MTLEDKTGKETTRLYEKKNCASGIIDTFLNKPLWEMHTYFGNPNWTEIYCPKHKETYDRIKAKERLDELDGK